MNAFFKPQLVATHTYGYAMAFWWIVSWKGCMKVASELLYCSDGSVTLFRNNLHALKV